MPMQISKLTLDKFRGASQKLEIDFDTKKSLVMIFGENGTGKSTVIDAIDFIANEHVGSLEVRSSISVKQHTPTIGHKPENIEITLVASTGTWKGKLNGSKFDVSGPKPRPTIHILRRGHLLKLMEAPPSERYKQLAQFIDVGLIEAGEDKLKKAVDEVKQSLNESVQSQAEAKAALATLWESEGKPGVDAESWGATKAGEDVTKLKTIADESQKAISAINLISSDLTTYKANLTTRDTALTNLQAAEAEVASHVSGTATGQMELVDLLGKVQTYLAKTKEVNNCPVCEQSVQKQELVAGVDAKLESFKKEKELNELHGIRKKKLGDADASLKSSLESLTKKVKAFALTYAASTLKPFEGVKSTLTSATAVLAKAVLTDDEKTQIVLTAEKAVELLKELQAVNTESGTAVSQHNAISQHYERIKSSEETSKKNKSLMEALQKAHKKTQDCRKKFSQDILIEVSKETDRLYALIHPGEKTGLSEIRIERRASLEHYASFHGHTDIPPQAYFSDSHLDTLGLALWLAIAKRQDPKNSIVILDDVFTSVDSPHLAKICDMLNTESTNFGQMIVTTHYRNWRDRYRFGQGPGAITQLVELQRWSLTRGVLPTNSKLAATQLRDHIDATEFDRQVVAAKAGILLEALLDALALQYRCSVPRNRDNLYTLSDLTGSCTSLFKKMKLEHEGDASPLEPKSSLDAIKLMAIIRNEVGCHHNEFGKDFSDDEVVTFAEEIHKLATMLTCHNCAELAQYKKGTHFACSCGKMKMTPLQLS
jgi:ABC-type transport system involved in cytochrome c biogenesis ATPase subunit